MKIDTKSLLIGIILAAGISILYLELTKKNSKNQTQLTNSNNEIGRYVPFGKENNSVLDTKNGEVWWDVHQEEPWQYIKD